MRLGDFVALVQGASDPFDPKVIKQWRKDLRRMTKIYRDIKVPESVGTNLKWRLDTGRITQREYDQAIKDQKKAEAKFEEARKLFVTFRQNFEKWWQYKFLPAIKREDAPWYHEQVIQKAFRASTEIGDTFHMKYESGDYQKGTPDLARLDREREKEIRRYQKAWNEAFKAIDEYIEVVKREKEWGVKLPPGTDDRPALEQMDIEGFPVLLRGWNLLKPADAKKSVDIIRQGLKLYKENAKKRLPTLLKYTLPFHAAWECRDDQAATYDEFKTRIKLCMNWPTAGRPDIKRMAHVIAHEMGHHLWKKVLSGSARKFWEAAIDADWGPIDLQRLLKLWPDDVKFSSSLADKLAKTDPTLALQIEVANSHYGHRSTKFDTKEDLQELIDQGKTVLTMKNPITEYATKNNEEAFCEAVGSLVGYGPRTLHPLTRKWLQTILPGMRMGSFRISEMILAATPMVTVPYLKKLSKLAEDSSKFYPQTKNAIDSALKDLTNEFSGVKPYPVSELWETLVFKGAPEDDIPELKKVKVPRARAKKAPTKMDSFTAWQTIEKASGKSVIDGVKWDRWPDPTKTIKAWAKALETLKKYRRAHKIYQKSVKKVMLREPQGTEEAQWKAGGILALTVPKGPTQMTWARRILIHELGHAFEDYFDARDIDQMAGQGGLYGKPPYVSAYAATNSSEDFADTFLALETEPALLKRKAPEKYVDMLRRTKEKL